MDCMRFRSSFVVAIAPCEHLHLIPELICFDKKITPAIPIFPCEQLLRHVHMVRCVIAYFRIAITVGQNGYATSSNVMSHITHKNALQSHSVNSIIDIHMREPEIPS